MPARVSLAARRLGKGTLLAVDCQTVKSEAKKTSGVEDFKDFKEDYDVLETLGQGSAAVVYRALRHSNGQEVALKVVRTCDEELVSAHIAEYHLLQRCSHPNIVRALDFHRTPNGIMLELSFFAGKALDDTVRREEEKRLPETTSQKLFRQLLEALDHLHQRRIVHRDIKPANVMISDDLTTLQLLDFNIARYLPDGGALSPNCSWDYAAPEVHRGGSPSEASDIWGAGLCLHMMLSGRCPGIKRQGKEITLKAMELSRITGACRATVRQCLAMEHSMRPAAMTLLQTAWLRLGCAEETRRNGPTSRKRSNSCSSHSTHEDNIFPTGLDPSQFISAPIARTRNPSISTDGSDLSDLSSCTSYAPDVDSDVQTSSPIEFAHGYMKRALANRPQQLRARQASLRSELFCSN